VLAVRFGYPTLQSRLLASGRLGFLLRVAVADGVSPCGKRSSTTSPSRRVGSVCSSDDTTQRAYGEAKLRASTPNIDPSEVSLGRCRVRISPWDPPDTRSAPS
jgi:hypothetical protein